MNPERGSIRLTVIASAGYPAGHYWGAEYGTFWATAPTKEEAVAKLRTAMARAGRVAPERVYDVAATIAMWMN